MKTHANSYSVNSPESLSKLLALASRASQTVPFYQESFGSIDFTSSSLSLEDLPILTKDLARSLQEKLVKNTHVANSPGEVIEYTSGSTGIPLRLIRTHAEVMQSARILWRSREACFPEVFHTFGILLVPDIQKNRPPNTSSCRKKEGTLSLSTLHLSPDNIGDFLDELDCYQPDWLSGSPAILSVLAEYMRRTNRHLYKNLAFIENTNDLLSPEARAFLEEIFHCRVFNHYGCREMYTIAYECLKGKMHVCDDAVVAEFHPCEAIQEAELIVSSLLFETMPFIRYKIGDFIQPEENSCTCGNVSPVLGEVRGRTSEIIANTVLIGNIVFSQVVAYLHQSIGARLIRQFQVQQTALNHFEVLFVLDQPELLEEVGKQFQEIARLWLSNATFSFKMTEYIEILPGGKLQSFIRCL